MSKSSTPVMEVKEVTKIFHSNRSFLRRGSKGIVALNRVSLEVREREIFGLVGESGSGKTTVGRLIVRLEQADSGQILLDGVDIGRLKGRALKAYRQNVQMIFQDPYQSLNPQVSILDTVSEPIAVHKLGKGRDRRQMVSEALRAAGLSPPEEFFNRYPHQLSGGQRQRVAIARAMVLRPEFVVADEPTSMLDASISAQIFNILLTMRDELNAALLFITHSLAAARYLCDRIAVIYKGSLMEQGPAEEVIHNPKHPYTRALLDALPRFGHCEKVRRYGTLLSGNRQGVENRGCPFFPRCAVAREPQCRTQVPMLEEWAPNHSVACFFPEKEGAGPEIEGEKCFFGI